MTHSGTLSLSYLLQTITESGEYLSHVPSLLHGDDSGVVLLIHPHQEVLVLVVPDPSSVRPVSTHPRRQQ